MEGLYAQRPATRTLYTSNTAVRAKPVAKYAAFARGLGWPIHIRSPTASAPATQPAKAIPTSPTAALAHRTVSDQCIASGTPA